MRLAIKAANGKHKDLMVEVEAEWTVKELKNYIYRHHPVHPAVVSQKLVSSGQLLKDTELVIDKLPQSGNDVPVFHLVMYERSVSAPAGIARQVSTQPSLEPVGEDEATQTPDGPARSSSAPQTDGGASSLHARMSSPSLHPGVGYHPPGQGIPTERFVPVQQVPVFGGPGTGNIPFNYPYNNMFAAQMAQWYQNYYARPDLNASYTALPTDNGEAEEDDLDPQEVDRVQDVDLEDDMPVNAAGGIMAAPDFQHRRDVIDFLYMFMMATLLGTVAYMTGSLGRFLIFAAGVVFMLLNQAGWFSLQRRQVRRSNEPGPHQQNQQQVPETEEQVLETEQQVPEREPEVPEEQQAEAEAADEANSTSSGQRDEGEPTQAAEEQPRAGLLSTLFVFVTSFFTSLIPHENPELQMNN